MQLPISDLRLLTSVSTRSPSVPDLWQLVGFCLVRPLSAKLFHLRQDADYGDMFEPSREQCQQAIEQAKEFVQHIGDFSRI